MTKWWLIFDFFKKNKFIILTAILTGISFNVLTLLIPISLGRFYEFNFDITSQRLKLTEAIPFINTENFNHFLVFFLVLVLFRFLLEYANRFVIAIIGEGFAKELREKLFAHQLNILTSVYDQKGIGKYLLRYSGDLKSIQNYITRGIFRFAQDIFLIIILIITIAYINLSMGLIITFAIGLTMALLMIINKFLYTASVARRNKRSNMLSFVNTRLRAIQTIKVYNKYTPEENRYNRHSRKLYKLGKHYQKLLGFIQAFIPFVTYFILTLLMWYIYWLKNKQGQNFNGSEFLILILLTISFLPILRRSLRVNIVWKLGDISFEKLLNIFQLEAENTLSFEKLDFSSQDISFQKVSFSYDIDSPEVFKNVDINFKANALHLIIGSSGSGKHTFINLLSKLYEPQEGIITIGDYAYHDLSEKTIRKNIAVVSNMLPLYGKTVFEAVAYNPTQDRRIRAEKLLDELQKYENNKMSLDNEIGDLGSKLTRGQYKILMLCRALLTNKPILIIDNPFSYLQQHTIAHLSAYLNKLKKKRTILLLSSEAFISELKIDHTYAIQNKKIKKFS